MYGRLEFTSIKSEESMKTSLLFSLVALSVCLAPAAHAAGDPVAGKKQKLHVYRLSRHCRLAYRLPNRVTACRIWAANTPTTSSPRSRNTKAGSVAFPPCGAIAASLTDQDMEDLAAYYSEGK